jgi:Myb-like DNA-binding domain
MVKNGEIEEQIEYTDDYDDFNVNVSSRSLPIPLVPREGSKMRKRWTDEERDAIQRGVLKYGVGCWKQIKEDDDLADVLSERTTVQIKVSVIKKSTTVYG